MAIKDEHPTMTNQLINLADSTLGSEALFATDDFFAAKERMLAPSPAVFIADKYDENGKWMDGWETRRKRMQGQDYCIVKLGLAGLIRKINIDTSFFTGNFAPLVSIEACYSQDAPNENNEWQCIVPPSPLEGDSDNWFAVDDAHPWTHLKVNIFPDGGIARLRVYGEVYCDWSQRNSSQSYDLLALENGGKALECNDEHFGAMSNLIRPGRGVNMGDGWETRRRREPGFDWVIMKLGHPGTVNKIEIDTAHFKGNYPHRLSIQMASLSNDCDQNLAPRSLFWQNLLPEQALTMDKQHFFTDEINENRFVSHVRVDIHPDGGLSRVRLFGNIDR